nr:type II toxin-antitoxin system VapC family toxin [uncultured Rhodopila sp.]
MYIDSSAIISILTNEPDAAKLARTIDTTPNPITSPIAVVEATLGLRRQFDLTADRAEGHVSRFLAAAGIEIVPILARDAAAALDAFRRFGKDHGHPDGLNMAGCFAYAVARNRGRLLLHTGDAFGKTDIESG